MENPELVSGIPLIIIGVLGFLAVAGLLFAPDRTPEAADVPETAQAVAHSGGHPSPAQYIGIGLFLGAITVVEVWVYYVDAVADALTPILLVLSITKFIVVVLMFMHLAFDSRIFSTLFVGGLLLALSLFVVVLTTLGAGLT
jgi:heme/copper-type cytochrome/quinol oxidase subunit 4